jgi:uncharacterized protein YceH (UPF0502 family)
MSTVPVLSEVECRVLGALIEKDITTPDYYPLSLNALVNACNQKNNRDPVMNLDENAVRDALHSLQEKRLAGPAGGADSRVTKYEHRIQEVFNFTRAETAFEELSDVQSTLQRLMQREPPLVKMLPRQPGTKESRYAHLLAGDVEGYIAPPESASTNAVQDDERVVRLETEVAELRREVADLKQQMESFRRQFE